MKEVLTGTTIIACTFDGGVVLGADSRTSSGNYVANKVADKITKVCDRVYLCRSGSAAHTQAVAGYANLYLNQHAVELGEKGCSVRSVRWPLSLSLQALQSLTLPLSLQDRREHSQGDRLQQQGEERMNAHTHRPSPFSFLTPALLPTLTPRPSPTRAG